MEEQRTTLKSKSLYRAENNLRGKLRSTFLRRYPHNIVPGYNLNDETSVVNKWNITNAIGLFQEFPYNCDWPRPLLPPARLSRAVLNEDDPALHLLTIKRHVNDEVDRIIDYYKKYKKDMGSMLKKDVTWKKENKTENAIVPAYVANVAEILDRDPDPSFEGTYNWYYTGGTLNNAQLCGQNILLFPFADELVAAPLNLMTDFMWKPILKRSAKCKLDGLLYELRHSTHGGICRILGRYKNHCTIYTLSETVNERLRLNPLHVQHSKVPFVSTDISPFNINYYCTLNAQRSVTLWDVNKIRHVNSYNIIQTKVQDDAWGSVKFHPTDNNIILFVDRCCIHYLDVRIPFDRPALSMCPKSSLEECEKISTHVSSAQTPSEYLATYHSLLMCDSRSPMQCVRQKWTHQFKSAPLLSCVTNRFNNEMIVISSQTVGECAIILNSWINEDETAHSYNLPFTPPNIMDTLNESQMQGKCLDPHLRFRLQLCNTGSALVTNNDGNVFLFGQNSAGDIFYQCITHEGTLNKYSVINCKSCGALDAWEHSLSKQKSTIVPLTISEKCNMRHIYKSFTRTQLRLNRNETDKHSEDSYDPSWKQSLDKLGSYIDILAPELLAVWDVSENVSLAPSPAAAPHQKVLNWLETTTIDLTNPSEKLSLSFSQDDPDCTVLPTATNNQTPLSREQELIHMDDTDALQLLLPKVKMRTLKKKRKR